MKNLFLVLMVVFSSPFSLMAWQNADPDVMRNGTIEEQFEFVLNRSNKYNQDGISYRVVRTRILTQLESNVDEAIEKLETDLNASSARIEEQSSEIASLKDRLNSTNADLEKVTTEKNNMNLLGVIPMKKAAYRTIMWVIVAGLVALLIFFIVSFWRSNAVTRQTKKTLEKTRDEFEAFRKKSMEDELVLRRKLQTEINKNLD
jgi:septal ring factor EnvC (AmiA/AmiB activator)